jgi:hypothetical protein
LREDRRRRVIALKERRRVEVGPYLSFVFENRETLPSASSTTPGSRRRSTSTAVRGRAGLTVPGSFEAGHSDEEKGKLAAVHFVRFAVSREVARSFRDSEVHLAVDHPAARARARLSDEAKAELLTDLTP